MNDSGAPTDEKDMAHIYLDELQHLAAAGLAAAAPTRHGRQHRPRAGLRRKPGTQLARPVARALLCRPPARRPGHRLGGAAHRARARRRGADRRRFRAGLSRLRAGRRAGRPACPRARRGLHRRHQQPSLRRGRLPPGSHGRPGPGWPGAEQFARRHARLGRQAATVRHQSHRRRLSPARRRAGDRPVAVAGGARQADDRRARQPAHSAGLGAGRRRQSHHRSKAGLAGSMLPAGGVKAPCWR